MLYAASLLNHLKALQQSLRRLAAEGSFDARDLTLLVREGERGCRLAPRFLIDDNGKLRYTSVFSEDVRGFAGWLPYVCKRWALASDKLAFKRYAGSIGVRVPRHWQSGAGIRGKEPETVVVKQARSSFGEGLCGPLVDWIPARLADGLAPGEFAERFIAGRVLKAWYWNGRLQAVELREPPRVQGDGVRDVRALADALHDHFARPIDWQVVEAVARTQGVSLQSVPACGTSVVVDFKYGSPLWPLVMANENVVATLRPGAIAAQLEDAGTKLWLGVPEPIRRFTLFTLDAIVDEDEAVWFLEMNSNPAVHPDCYDAMIESLLRDPLPPAARREEAAA